MPIKPCLSPPLGEDYQSQWSSSRHDLGEGFFIVSVLGVLSAVGLSKRSGSLSPKTTLSKKW